MSLSVEGYKHAIVNRACMNAKDGGWNTNILAQILNEAQERKEVDRFVTAVEQLNETPEQKGIKYVVETEFRVRLRN